MIAVTMTKDRWAGVIRLMREGQDEGWYYVGRDDENKSLISDICTQSGITEEEAHDMEPERDISVPRAAD